MWRHGAGPFVVVARSCEIDYGTGRRPCFGCRDWLTLLFTFRPVIHRSKAKRGRRQTLLAQGGRFQSCFPEGPR
ncbi:unnamed protein product [Amoebophrya sp. A120]|nr:unnamed protein product [Amoebophrya sp. A120]|eukprot:GSA120T00024545001.1